MMLLTKLSIVNYCCYAYHGVEESERQLGGKFQVDIDMWYDASKAIKVDSVSEAVNYRTALDIIADVIRHASFDLIETMAGVLSKELLNRFPLTQEVAIRIRKCNVPIKQVVDYVQAECHVKRRKRKIRNHYKIM